MRVAFTISLKLLVENEKLRYGHYCSGCGEESNNGKDDDGKLGKLAHWIHDFFIKVGWVEALDANSIGTAAGFLCPEGRVTSVKGIQYLFNV